MRYYKYFIISAFICFLDIVEGYSQDTVVPQSTTPEEKSPELSSLGNYTDFKLPPLQTLLENAMQNPQVRQTDAHIEVARYELKIEKRKWLSYFSARASYNYGILGTYVDMESAVNPLTTTYTGSSQSSYSVGANISIPLNDVLSRGLATKRQKKILEEAECNKEIIYNTLKAQIIQTYSDIYSSLAIMQNLSETMAIFDADYKIMQNKFINGKASPKDLAVVKNGQKETLQEYEGTRAMLTSLILKLELMTNTKLINK